VPSETQPNILLVLTDQQRPDWVGTADVPVRTPNYDRLVERGVEFSNAVCPAPLCGPSRICLAGGTEYARGGVRGTNNYPGHRPTLYERLRRDAGYRTIGIGDLDLIRSPYWGLDGDHQLDEIGFDDGIEIPGKNAMMKTYRNHIRSRAEGNAGSYDPEETMTALAHLRDRGLIEHIGVSNFEPAHLDAARAATDAPIFANQVEMHPFLPQTELRSYTAAADMELVAYSPLDRGAVFEDPTLGEIAKAHGVSEAQVSLAWLREKGVTAIPKATAESHVRDNWKSLALELTEEDVAAIDAIDRRQRRVNPGFGPDAWN
jgi:arylsulfatase A-like enzyme